jgi:hypothetical protein
MEYGRHFILWTYSGEFVCPHFLNILLTVHLNAISAGSNIVGGMDEYLFVVFCSNDGGHFYMHKNLAVFRTFGGNEISARMTGNGERIECKTMQVAELRNILIKSQ